MQLSYLADRFVGNIVIQRDIFTCKLKVIHSEWNTSMQDIENVTLFHRSK